MASKKKKVKNVSAKKEKYSKFHTDAGKDARIKALNKSKYDDLELSPRQRLEDEKVINRFFRRKR